MLVVCSSKGQILLMVTSTFLLSIDLAWILGEMLHHQTVSKYLFSIHPVCGWLFKLVHAEYYSYSTLIYCPISLKRRKIHEGLHDAVWTLVTYIISQKKL